MKLCSFFCAGAVIHKAGRDYIHELDGFGWRMPKVFVMFTVSSLALMGVPGLCGFVSKWYLVKAALDSGGALAYAGVGALLVSALLTAIYMLSIVVRAFFPGKDFDYSAIRDVEDPNWMMLVPIGAAVIFIVVIGLHSGPLAEMLERIAGVI